MSNQSELLKNTEVFATEILKNRLPDHLYYHTYQHTLDVVKSSKKIGTQNQLGEIEMEIILLAAWLHDVGYSEVAAGHEDKSIELAKNFFESQEISEEKAQAVYECIKATQIPQTPPHILAEVLCDADLAHLAADDFFERCEPLRQEWDANKEIPMTDKEWYQVNANFISKHQYFTRYGRDTLEIQKQKNLRKVENRLKKIEQELEKMDNE